MDERKERLRRVEYSKKCLTFRADEVHSQGGVRVEGAETDRTVSTVSPVFAVRTMKHLCRKLLFLLMLQV